MQPTLPQLRPDRARSPQNIVISGTNFWNPGDDFVRDGVIRVLRELFRGIPCNFLFYNFNADFLISYLPHPGTAIYIGYNSDLQNFDQRLIPTATGLLTTRNDFLNDSRQFFVKVSYLFRP